MAELSERHEVRVRGKDSTIVFSADSNDGKLVIWAIELRLQRLGLVSGDSKA